MMCERVRRCTDSLMHENPTGHCNRCESENILSWNNVKFGKRGRMHWKFFLHPQPRAMSHRARTALAAAEKRERALMSG